MSSIPLSRRMPRALGALGACGVALAALPAAAASFNVSLLVNGVQTSPPIYLPPAPPQVDCGANCQYVNVASTGMTNSFTTTPEPYTVGAWPPVYGTSPASLATVQESVAIPAPPSGQVLDGGSIGAAQRSHVTFDWQPLLGGTRMMGVQTWKTGAGASSVSYALRVNTPAGSAKHTWLEFRVPTLARGWQYAYYVGGPSGNQPITTLPNRVQTRATVDVYADGLPVWSSQSNLLQPLRYDADYANDWVSLAWGQPLADDLVTLYLGHLPASSTRTLAVVLRTDLRTEAPTCKTDTDYGTTYLRCHSQREAMSIPAVSVQSGLLTVFRPAVRVYTR